MSRGYEWDVFVSYGRADHDIVRRLADELQALGMRVWIDEDCVSVGESIPGAIEKGISGSRSMVVCFSSNYASSEWAQMELAAAQYADPANQVRSLIPIRLDEHPLPRTVAPLRYLELLDRAMVPGVAKSIASSVFDDPTLDAPLDDVPTMPSPNRAEVRAENSLAARWDAVLLIAALNKESEALRRLLAFSSARRTQSAHRDRPYELYKFPGGQQLVLVTLGMSGRLSAALAAREFVDLLPFKAMFLVGICGALSQSLRIGDIVISDQVVDYEAGKVTANGTERRWRAYSSSFALTTALNSFRGDGWRWLIREMLPGKEEPRAQSGTVLSGDKVIASLAARKELTSAWPAALGVEMEAAGIASMLSQREGSPPFVMVKSVCDLADESKNDDFQKAAATAAAAFVIEFLLESWAATD